MAKKINITGKNLIDEAHRTEALQELQNQATTEELLKLKKAIHNPRYRSMLKMI